MKLIKINAIFLLNFKFINHSFNLGCIQSKIQKFNSSGYPISWELSNVEANQTVLSDTPFGDISKDNYTVLNSKINFAHYSSFAKFIRFEPVLGLITIDTTDWIWPKYNTLIHTWLFPLPTFILNSKYSFKIGKVCLNLKLNFY